MDNSQPSDENFASCYLGLLAFVVGVCLTIYLKKAGYGWYLLAWFGLTFAIDTFFVADGERNMIAVWKQIIKERNDESLSNGGYPVAVVFMIFMTYVGLMFAPYFWIKDIWNFWRK